MHGAGLFFGAGDAGEQRVARLLHGDVGALQRLLEVLHLGGVGCEGGVEHLALDALALALPLGPGLHLEELAHQVSALSGGGDGSLFELVGAQVSELALGVELAHLTHERGALAVESDELFGEGVAVGAEVLGELVAGLDDAVELGAGDGEGGLEVDDAGGGFVEVFCERSNVSLGWQQRLRGVVVAFVAAVVCGAHGVDGARAGDLVEGGAQREDGGFALGEGGLEQRALGGAGFVVALDDDDDGGGRVVGVDR